MMTFLVFMLILAGVEMLARVYERKTVTLTAVSTARASDHALTRVEAYIRLAILILFAGLGALSAFLEASALIVAILALLFLSLRILVAKLDRTAAQASCLFRLQQVLKTPEFNSAQMVFFFSAPDLKTPSHVYAWENEIQAVGAPWFAIVAEAHHLRAFRQDASVPVVFFHDMAVGPALLPPDVRVVLYANNGQKNRKLIALREDLTHVQMLHGDSDKPPSYSPLTKNYDLVFVAGQMGIDRYKTHGVDIPENRFRIVGRPQVRELLDTTEVRPQEIALVSYLPTWRGFYEDTQYSSLDRVDQIADTVLSCKPPVRFSFKPHPMSYKDPDWLGFLSKAQAVLKRHAARGAGAEICPNDISPFDLYKQSDIIICDISSVMIDFLYTGKPILVVLPERFKESERVNFPSLTACYEVRADLSNLEEQLNAALGEDPMAATRQKVRAYAFGDGNLPPGEAFKRACLDAIAGRTELSGA
ncbi:MAG: hypothetical protein CR993_06315 [Rhodobacterales bacterium]|nr:MAG: hypothetical protein CR993_06315 [Rhodobacterales bacterium]